MSATWVPTLSAAAPPKEGGTSRAGRATFYRPQTRVHQFAASQHPARSQNQGVRARASVGKAARVWGSSSFSRNEPAIETPQPARRVWRGTKAKQHTPDAVSEVDHAISSEPTVFNVPGADATICGDVLAIAELTSDKFRDNVDDANEDTMAETTSSVKVFFNSLETSSQEESLVPELANYSQAAEQDRGAHKTRRIRNRYPKQDYVAKTEWPSPDPEEETAIIERVALENAIAWCKGLLPREMEQKTIEDGADYEALDGAEVLLPKGLRMSNLVYIEPTVSKKASKKTKPSRARDTIKHTAETFRIFSFLGVQAPLLVADVAPTLEALQKRLIADKLDRQYPDEESTEAGDSATFVDAETSAENAPVENSPQPPLPDIQEKLESLAEQGEGEKEDNQTVGEESESGEDKQLSD